jgi:hypothetical protein
MRSLRNLDRRISAVIACLGLIVGVALPAAFPIIAYAGSITSRSIALSSSAADGSGVAYHLTATLQTGLSAGGGLVIEFCSDSPLVGLTCTHPSGFSAASVTTTGSTTAGTATSVNSNFAISWAATGAVTGGSTVDVTFNAIHNPTAVGTFYARMTSYTSSANLGGYTDSDTLGTYADSGGIALSTTNNIGVTAYVRESMTFCLGGGTVTVPTASCGNAGSLLTPSMTIGEDIGGGSKALDPSAVSTGTDTAQLSTNAAGGAVVNLHTSTVGCGGLVRPGSANCDIIAQNNGTATTINNGDAKFGLKLGSTSDVGTASGALTPAGSYGSTNYYLHYVSGDATGVTSPYGSPLFNSGGAPVSNKNIPITFGASAANTTPAGIYSATLNLIATGTF